jgi:hypothetical protein
MRAACCTAALLAIISNASAGAPLTPQEQAIFANLLAEEFTSVCIKSDARQGAVEIAALRRGWRPHPVEITTVYSVAAKAWEGDIKQINVGRGVTREAVSFIAAVTDEAAPTGRECIFLNGDISFEALRNAMINQGLKLYREDDWGGDRGYEHRSAIFCSPSLYAERKKHEVVIQRRNVPGRPVRSGASISFSRDFSVSRAICPQNVSIGASGGEPDPPRIEPWLGQKPLSPPEPLEE